MGDSILSNISYLDGYMISVECHNETDVKMREFTWTAKKRVWYVCVDTS